MDIAGILFDAFAAIDAEEYTAQKTAALKKERKAEAAAALGAELSRLEGNIDHQTEQAIAREREAERKRLGNGASHPMIDVVRIDRADSPAALSLILAEAETVGPAELRRVWEFARPRLEALARSDIRHHRIGGRGSALAVMTRWQMRVATLGHTAPDEASRREQARHQKASVRARVSNIAQVAGTDLAHAMKVAAVAPPEQQTEGRMQIGPNFRQFFSRR